jgi:acetylornithine deacetylase
MTEGGRRKVTDPACRQEERVVEAIRERSRDLVDLLTELISFDTTARLPGDPPRDEEALQRALANRMEALGAETDLWEPEPTGSGNRHYPDHLDFTGRPQLVATVPGRGGGPSLLLNGHIDAVSVDAPELWSVPPLKGTVKDGHVLGRGANDMKGGIAALVVALEGLAAADVRLAGDVVFCTVTDEESSGAGGWAALKHGVGASAGICAEPTDLNLAVACRGTVCPTITVPGRQGHAEIPQPHWRDGGAVNAIEKAQLIIDAARRLREEWRTRPEHRHPLLQPGDIVPTVMSAGKWHVTYPASCTIRFDCQYLPTQVDANGTGWAVQDEIVAWMEQAAATDPWLREHPIEWTWSNDVVPAEIPADSPLVIVTQRCAQDMGRSCEVAGFGSWHDAATFSAHGTPTFSFGPRDFGTIHGVDERVSIDDLVDVAVVVALTAMRYCGVAGDA